MKNSSYPKSSSSRRVLLGAGLLCATLGACALRAATPDKENPPPGATEKEVEMGRKAAESLEKNPKVKLLDPAKSPEAKVLVDKLNKMAQTLGKVSARPDIKYEVKVIEDKDINAFTLPDGHIYFYKGLIDFADSDDEIAAVLAHEIGHNTRLHALRGEAKPRKLSWVGLAAMLAAIGAGRSGADIAQFSQYLLVGIMNGYGVEYEKEADDAAVNMLVKTNYNPSALVSFMQRLSLEEKAHPEVELGIFRTHPPSEERATAAKAEMQQLGVTYNPREVGGGRLAKVVESDRLTVKRGDVALFELAAASQGADEAAKTAALQRAQAAADRVNELVTQGLQMHELRTEPVADGVRILGRNTEIVRVSAADAALAQSTPAALAEKWRTNLSRLFWREAIGRKL